MIRRIAARIGSLVSLLLVLPCATACLFVASTDYGNPVRFPVAGPSLPPVSVMIDSYTNGVLAYHADCAVADDTPPFALRRQQRIVTASVFAAWQPLLDTSEAITIIDQKPLPLPPTCGVPRALGAGTLAAPARGSDLRLSVGIAWSERGDVTGAAPMRTATIFVLRRDGTLFLPPPP